VVTLTGTLLSAVRASDDSSGAGRNARVMVMARDGGDDVAAAEAAAWAAEFPGEGCGVGRRYW
jgi:hypothetical protein